MTAKWSMLRMGWSVNFETTGPNISLSLPESVPQQRWAHAVCTHAQLLTFHLQMDLTKCELTAFIIDMDQFPLNQQLENNVS